MQNAQNTKNACPNCGADMAYNPRTGKNFCSAKCWLKPQGEEPQASNVKQSPNGMYAQTDFYKGKQKSYSKFDSQSAYVSYTKDLLIAMMEHTTDKSKFDVIQASQLAIQIIGAMKSVFKEE